MSPHPTPRTGAWAFWFFLRVRIQLWNFDDWKGARPMTAIDERSTVTELTAAVPTVAVWAAEAGLVPDQLSPGEPTRQAPQPRSEGPRSRGEAELRTLKVARWAASMIMVLIAVACFVLSFSSLWDLASRSVSWPRHLAWLWPLIVDGVVVVATIAIRAMAETSAAAKQERLRVDEPDEGDDPATIQQRRDRAFFWWMLVAGASVSVAGNGLHSLLPAGQPLSPWLSVVIGCVPACALLAATHALQRLSRLQIRPPAEVDGSEVMSARAAAVAEQRAGKWHAVAAGIHERGLLANQSTDTLMTAMTLLFDVKPTPSLRSIAAQIGATHHDVVVRVRDAALLVLNDTASQ